MIALNDKYAKVILSSIFSSCVKTVLSLRNSSAYILLTSKYLKMTVIIFFSFFIHMDFFFINKAAVMVGRWK